MLRSAVIPMTLVVMMGCQGKDPGSRMSGATSAERREKTEVDKLLDSRPAPDLADLADRSAVGRRGKDAGEAFWDVLKLRETGAEEAVPVLERILAEHANSTRIHGYAAAQALFYMDTPQAHSILSRHLLSPSYDAKHGIRYTFHWDMDESRRDAFIERYHLKHLSEDATVTLTARPEQGQGGDRIVFSVAVRNTSDKPFRLLRHESHWGDMLYFRAAGGRFAKIVRTRDVCRDGPPQYLELTPGASHRYEVAVDVRRTDNIDGHRGWYGWLPKDATLVLTTGGVAYGVHQPGDYEVRAMLELPEPTEAQVKFAGFDNLWFGRAVSPPVKVNVVTPSPRRTELRP